MKVEPIVHGRNYQVRLLATKQEVLALDKLRSLLLGDAGFEKGVTDVERNLILGSLTSLSVFVAVNYKR